MVSCNAIFHQQGLKLSVSTIRNFISQSLSASVLREMHMLLVCSLSFFFASESLFLGSVLKEGKKFNKVFFSSLVSFLLKSVCNDFCFYEDHIHPYLCVRRWNNDFEGYLKELWCLLAWCLFSFFDWNCCHRMMFFCRIG